MSARRNGLTAWQAAEVTRLQARYGRLTASVRMDGRVFVAIHGDNPAPGERPRVLLLDEHGRVTRFGPRPVLNDLAPERSSAAGATTQTRRGGLA